MKLIAGKLDWIETSSGLTMSSPETQIKIYDKRKMWFELSQAVIFTVLIGTLFIKDTYLEHNRALLKSIELLLPNDCAFEQPKIQEYIKKLLDKRI